VAGQQDRAPVLRRGPAADPAPGPEPAAGRDAVLPREFFGPDALDVAPALLGRVVEHATDAGTVAVRLTEVEAYHGEADPGSHAYRGKTRRNAVMFGEPGHVYVYFTYGMHWCANLVCGTVGVASAVLLRAGEVVAGAELARDRRPSCRRDADLARGPARLASCLGLTGEQNGADGCGSGPLRILTGAPAADAKILTGPRVGVAQGGDVPWRFWLADDPTVSVYRPHKPRRRVRSA
jgi:DNA-3-methyladenine glycosylase